MSDDQRKEWERRHREMTAGAPEASLVEAIPVLPRGRALDIAAGTGRHSFSLARAGFSVVAVDYSATALHAIARASRADNLTIEPVAVDLDAGLPFCARNFEVVLNVNFLMRELIPEMIRVLKPGGALFFETFLSDELGVGHLRNPDYALGHYELRGLLGEMELRRYREGLVEYSDRRRAWRAWRAMALAFRRDRAND